MRVSRNAGRTGASRSHRWHAARVAAVTTVAAGVAYCAVCVTVNVLAGHRLTSSADLRLDEAIESFVRAQGTGAQVLTFAPTTIIPATPHDVDEAPVFVWVVGEQGAVLASTTGAPALPVRAWPVERPGTLDIAGRAFLAEAEKVPRTGTGSGAGIPGYPGASVVVAATGLAGRGETGSALLRAEVLIAPFLLGLVFVVAMLVGIRAAAPVEAVRRRQLEFTADASHELRTPVAIIDAEVQLALGAQRSPDDYRDALVRVSEESGRLRSIVDDLLWLARFDSMPQAPEAEPVDIGVVAAACAQRFDTVASAAGVTVSTEIDSGVPAVVLISAEWADRLAGVLIDNAWRHAGRSGNVTVRVSADGDRVRLCIEDTGPGISEEERERIFTRFHRASSEQPGSGLGLAIADAIVGTTGGRWRVGEASGGGASFCVEWQRRELER